MSDNIVLHDSNEAEVSSRALVLASSAEISSTSQQSNQLVEKLRNEREEHRHKQIWIKDPHGGPYRKAKAGDGYDPLTQNPDGTSKELELGYHFPVETGPTSNFVGNHMTQGAIDLVQSELGQKSAKTLRLQAAQNKIFHSATPQQQLSLPAPNRTNTPKLLLNEEEIAEIKLTNGNLERGIAPILSVVQGERPPDLTELRKAAANEKSFKLLQEYLAAADGKHGGGHSSLPYRFNFFVKKPAADEHQPDSKQEKDVEELFHKVSLTLPPPNRSLPHTTHHALIKLFNACGIQVSAAEISSDGNNTATEGSLTAWLPAVAELYYRSGTAFQDLRRPELHILRLTLTISHSISIKFGDKLATGSSSLQAEAVHRLADLLDQMPADSEVSGLQIGFGDQFGTDTLGTLWLNTEAEDATWLNYLQNPDVLSYCHLRRNKHRQIREKEEEAAKALGVKLVLAPDIDVEDSEEYEAFLQRVIEAGQGVTGSLNNNYLKKVCLHVVAAPPSSSPSKQIVSDGKGRILAPVSSSSIKLLAALRRIGPEAARHAEIAAKEDEELSALRTRVERKLRLRKLVCHPDLAVHKFKAGCLRMLDHAGRIGPFVDGLPIRLGEVNAFFPGQSHIDIAWDFKV